MKFSIIIPAYNAQATLGRAINSLLRQQYADIEIILVNDASTDQTADICATYEKKDPRIKNITLKINRGVGNARNRGLAAATGEYVGFLDADDYVDEMYDRIHTSLVISHADVLVYGITEKYFNTHRKFVNQQAISIKENIYDQTEAIGNLMLILLQTTLLRYAWNKVYKTSFLRQYAFGFKKDEYIEDISFNLKVFHKVKKVETLSITPYIYNRFSEGTLVNHYSQEYLRIHLGLIEQEYTCFSYFNILDKALPVLATELLKFIFIAMQMLSHGECMHSIYKKNMGLLHSFPLYPALRAKMTELSWPYYLLGKILTTDNELLIMSIAKIIYVLKHKYIRYWQFVH